MWYGLSSGKVLKYKNVCRFVTPYNLPGCEAVGEYARVRARGEETHMQPMTTPRCAAPYVVTYNPMMPVCPGGWCASRLRALIRRHSRRGYGVKTLTRYVYSCRHL